MSAQLGKMPLKLLMREFCLPCSLALGKEGRQAIDIGDHDRSSKKMGTTYFLDLE